MQVETILVGMRVVTDSRARLRWTITDRQIGMALDAARRVSTDRERAFMLRWLPEKAACL
ncbi:hypothetical protein [Methylobacterium fujisawaense]